MGGREVVFRAYADGSSNFPVSDKMGSGVVIEKLVSHELVERKVLVRSDANGTAPRAELTAILSALQLVDFGCRVTCWSDSQYSVTMLNRWYHEDVDFSTAPESLPNRDLIAAVRDVVRRNRCVPVFMWMRGHAGDLHNEFCDALASHARKNLKVGDKKIATFYGNHDIRHVAETSLGMLGAKVPKLLRVCGSGDGPCSEQKRFPVGSGRTHVQRRGRKRT